MAERVRITDVSPRDGLQNEPGVIPTADKVRLVELLSETGVDEVEVTSFVSARWVPQLGDAGEVCAGLLLPLPPGGGWGVGGIQESSGPAPAKQPVRQRATSEFAKVLRKAETGPEKALWEYLRRRELMGVKFRRQHPFGPYVLDFFCVEQHLAVELDGVTHETADAREHDGARDEWIASQGVRVLRYSDDQVVANAEGVALSIRAAITGGVDAAGRRIGGLVARDSSPTPQPPPGGRGSRKRLVYSALVPNERGFQSLLDANRAARGMLVSKAAVFTAASETFCRKNINATFAESLERFRPVIAAAHAEGILVRGYLSCVIACPFEGRIAPAAVTRAAAELVATGIDELDLGDTIGAGDADSVRALLADVSGQIPIVGARVPTTLHLHDTFGRAAECVKVALDMGIRSFDGSVAGLGGCPYASTPGKRAPGNISTETLVRTIHDAGYETGVDLDKLEEAAAFARQIVARARAESGGARA